ncbi:MAG: ATP-binding cassette domain-containing protein, partial [Rubrobacteraceae bacterium]
MISVQDVTFAYPDGKLAVDGVNFSVEPGEIFGFLGPSGAGKSTTQKILIGLLKGYHGGVEVMGRGLSRW